MASYLPKVGITEGGARNDHGRAFLLCKQGQADLLGSLANVSTLGVTPCSIELLLEAVHLGVEIKRTLRCLPRRGDDWVFRMFHVPRVSKVMLNRGAGFVVQGRITGTTEDASYSPGASAVIVVNNKGVVASAELALVVGPPEQFVVAVAVKAVGAMRRAAAHAAVLNSA